MKKLLAFLTILLFLSKNQALSAPTWPSLIQKSAETIGLDSIPSPQSRQNYLMVSGCAGGGDYPFMGFGLTLTHRSNPSDKSYFGIGAHYISNTINTENGLLRQEFVQIFPIMLDYRREFSRASNGWFSTYLMLDAGYVVSITGNELDQTGEYEYGNGWAFNPGLSFKFDFLKHTAFFLDISWMRHTSRLKWLPPADKVSHKKWDLALLRLSAMF